MARSNKLGGSNVPGVTPESLFEGIIADVLKAAAMSFDEWDALNPFPLTPLAIPVSADRKYRVTQVGVDAAYKLTDQTWILRKDFQQTIARSEFDKLSFRAIGEAVANCRAHLPRGPAVQPNAMADEAFYKAVVDDYRRALDRFADNARSDLDRHIPCHLFDVDQGVPAFSVGPVAFQPRADWLTQYVTDPKQLAHIREVESRTATLDDLRKRSEGDGGRDLYEARRVLSALRSFSWVATIRMTSHELSHSHRKASIIVGLAIDAIGLRFNVEDARRFSKTGRQHLFSEERLASSLTGAFVSGSSVQMPGLGAKPGALVAKMSAELPFLAAAGTILRAYLAGRQTGEAPHLVERWANALYWVGEARREASDFMAVVNYGCAADGLSGAGGNADVMTEFAEASLNPKGKPTTPEALSIADAVTRVYREGRNKLAHGEAPGLLEDLGESRAIGDDLLVKLMSSFTFELANVIDHRPEILTIGEKHAYRAFKERLRQRS